MAICNIYTPYASNDAQATTFLYMSTMPNIQHALIMGAGLAGPATALSLARRGIKSTIFEIRSSPSTSGGSITLAANALRALTQCAGDTLYDRLKATGYVYEKMAMTGDDGYHYGDLFVGESEGYPAVRIMRNDLHQVLLETCKEVGVELLLNKKLKDIEEKADGVELNFEDGHRATGTYVLRNHVLVLTSTQAISL